MKFLLAVEESNRDIELAIKKQNDSALLEFRFRNELLSRGYDMESDKIKPFRSNLNKFKENAELPGINLLSTEATFKIKRNLLGIAPKIKKSE